MINYEIRYEITSIGFTRKTVTLSIILSFIEI